jgi:hypothetical protein
LFLRVAPDLDLGLVNQWILENIFNPKKSYFSTYSTAKLPGISVFSFFQELFYEFSSQSLMKNVLIQGLKCE